MLFSHIFIFGLATATTMANTQVKTDSASSTLWLRFNKRTFNLLGSDKFCQPKSTCKDLNIPTIYTNPNIVVPCTTYNPPTVQCVPKPYCPPKYRPSKPQKKPYGC